MGGAAGRADAMVAAVEAQKAEGVLHVHLFVYLQMISQYSTLHELANALREQMISADAIKTFVSYVRCAEYPDVHQFQVNRSKVEKSWPAYSADSSLSRLPAFFWNAHTASSLDLSRTRI